MFLDSFTISILMTTSSYIYLYIIILILKLLEMMWFLSCSLFIFQCWSCAGEKIPNFNVTDKAPPWWVIAGSAIIISYIISVMECLSWWKRQPTSSPCGESKENIVPSPLSERQHSQFFLWGIPMLVWEGLLLLFLKNDEWMKDLSKLSLPPWTWCLNLVPKSLRESWWVSPSITILPPVTLSAWHGNMHRGREVMSIECRGQNQNCYRNPFWGLVKMKCVSWFCIKLLLWFSELSKYTFNFYFQNRYKVKDQYIWGTSMFIIKGVLYNGINASKS